MTTTTFFSVEITFPDDRTISEGLLDSILGNAPELEDAAVMVTEDD